jgi:hypothetical protein
MAEEFEDAKWWDDTLAWHDLRAQLGLHPRILRISRGTWVLLAFFVSLMSSLALAGLSLGLVIPNLKAAYFEGPVRALHPPTIIIALARTS